MLVHKFNIFFPLLLFTTTTLIPVVVLADITRDCTDSKILNEKVCFGDLSQLDVQVMENRERVMVTSLGPNCNPIVQLNYSVLMTSTEHEDIFGIEEYNNESTIGLWTQRQLDREFISAYNFTLVCTIKVKNITLDYNLPGFLTVLDEDDNPPLTAMGTSHATVYISLHPDKNKVIPGSRLKPDGNYTELTFEDKDTLDVNNFKIIKLNDTKELVQIKLIHHQLNHRAVPSTYGILKAVLGETRIGTWEGLYCVLVIVNDTSLTVDSENSKVTFNICLHLGTKPNLIPPQRLETNVEEIKTICGGTCIGTIVFGSSFLIITTIFFVLYWKCGWHRKSRPVKSVLINNVGGVVPGGSGNHWGNININGNGISEMSTYTIPGLTYEYMPVDLKWEVPRTSLMIQDVIGEGEFGRVHRAKFSDPRCPLGSVSDVAVKILKESDPNRGKSCRQEFMAEFSLLKQIDHLNVIKLIGACTSGAEPPYLIMEYCEFKSLKSFLRKCRHIEAPHCPSSVVTDVPVSCPGVDSHWEPYFVTPREIIGFSWQIAKGMAYLSEMKMVHRDLAARNILLTVDRICKISDFGLTRDVYVDEAYKKNSKDKVPVKWLALECLSDEVYTTKSDVWAFGILMWELVNLGATPYPGIPSEQLYTLLRNDYRMPQPENISDELYRIMKSCWAHEPSNRPSFRFLVDALGKLLEIGEDYLQVNINMVSNPGYGFNPVTQPPNQQSPPKIYPCNGSHPHLSSESTEVQVPDGFMENLRLIENEISTCGESGGMGIYPSSNLMLHTYMNHPHRNKMTDIVPSLSSFISHPSPPTTTISPHYESPIKKIPESRLS